MKIELKIEDGYLVTRLIRLDEEGREWVESEDRLLLTTIFEEMKRAIGA